MTTTQNSSHMEGTVQPVTILKYDPYQAATPTISALTFGGETIYIWNALRPQYFTELKDAVLAAYESAVRSRISYKRVCHGRDCSDEAIRGILDWVLENSHKENLSGVGKDIVAINNRFGFDHTAIMQKTS